jgi:hypothetical protein
VPFLAEVQSDGSAITLALTPLSSADRVTPATTSAGVPLSSQSYGPFGLVDGSLSADLSGLAIPGASNPLSDVDLVAQLTLAGSACDGFLCGSFEGQATSPVSVPLNGTFTFEALEGAAIPEPPRVDCSGRLADPL